MTTPDQGSGTQPRGPRYWHYTFLVCGPGEKRTQYGLLWEGRDDRKARAHVKAWANGYHGKPNRVMLKSAHRSPSVRALSSGGSE